MSQNTVSWLCPSIRLRMLESDEGCFAAGGTVSAWAWAWVGCWWRRFAGHELGLFPRQSGRTFAGVPAWQVQTNFLCQETPETMGLWRRQSVVWKKVQVSGFVSWESDYSEQQTGSEPPANSAFATPLEVPGILRCNIYGRPWSGDDGDGKSWREREVAGRHLLAWWDVPPEAALSFQHFRSLRTRPFQTAC